jgi:hypothetical protein
MPSLKHLLLATALGLASSSAFAQPPGPPPGGGLGQQRGPGGGQRGNAPATSVPDLVARMLTFDANKDDSLSRGELRDERLHALFDRADADQDGTATKNELTKFFTKENEALASSGGGPMGGPGGGRGPAGAPGDGPPRDRGPGAAGPPEEFRARQRHRPGQILPPGLQDRLELTDVQRRQIEALQEIVDERLEMILTPEQRQMLNEPGPPPGEPGRGGPPPRDDFRPQSPRPEPGNR